MIEKLYIAYISGCSMPTALEVAGLGHLSRQTGYNMIADKNNIPIVGKDLWTRAQMVRAKRAYNEDFLLPRTYTLAPIEKKFDDPFKDAEYIYSRIKNHY